MPILLLLAVLSVQNDTATVYVYRLEEVGRFQGNKPKVYLNDRLALMMPESEFIALRLPAGRHVIRTSSKRTATVLNVEAGQTYFVRVSRTGDGFSGMRDAVEIESAEQAAFQMRDFKPLEPKNVKDKTLEVTRDPPR